MLDGLFIGLILVHSHIGFEYVHIAIEQPKATVKLLTHTSQRCHN